MNDYDTDAAFGRKSGYLRPDCEKCFGLCCVALYCAASEGFPADKAAGKPCVYLNRDYRCRIHGSLKERGYKGCLVYDCLGAGQKVSRIASGGKSLPGHPESSKRMFDAFLRVCRLHELLWYLNLSLTYPDAGSVRLAVESKLAETERLSLLPPDDAAVPDLQDYESETYRMLFDVSELVRAAVRKRRNTAWVKKKRGPKADLFAADLRKTDLTGADLRGACLIAADLRGNVLDGTDLTGADLRDADIRNADLSGSLFVPQNRINAAKGNGGTKLPAYIIRPGFWPD